MIFFSTNNNQIDQDVLKQCLRWLVNLRWVGILGIFVTTHVVRETSVLSFSLIPVYLILGTAALFNFYYLWRLKLARQNLERQALLQIIVDQIILAASVYFSGGSNSPFIYFFLFHVVISGIILPWRHAYALAGMAVLFPGLIIGLSRYGHLPQFGIFKQEPLITDGSVIAVYGMAFISTIVLTIYFVTYLSKQLHEKTGEMLKLYNLSERLRSSIQFKDVIGIIEEQLRDFVGAKESYFLPLNKEKGTLQLSSQGKELAIPLFDKNSFTKAVLRGVALNLDRLDIVSSYELEAFGLMGAMRCLILPVAASTLEPCYENFQCGDRQCAAYGEHGKKCWQVSGTHCKGAIYGNDMDKLAVCLTCNLFTPVGVYLMIVQRPLSGYELEGAMNLLEAGSIALSNALLYEKTIQLSKTDGLTGLWNHREFREALEAELLRSQRYQRGLGFLMIDVDHFKHYNDTNGHPQGDVLLRKLAELFRDNFKDTDIVARYGGEEFAVLLPETGEMSGAVEAAERLKGMVDWCKFANEESQPGGKVTISIGVSCYPANGATVEELIQAADAALYQAKREGRNRVVAA